MKQILRTYFARQTIVDLQWMHLRVLRANQLGLVGCKLSQIRLIELKDGR